MTKKDYDAIAEAISFVEVGDVSRRESSSIKWDIVFRLAEVFKADNPNFNIDLFVEACYGEKN